MFKTMAYASPRCNRRKQVSKRWSPMPPISTKRTTTSHLNSLKKKKTTVYDVGNQGPALGHAHKYVGVKLVNGIPTLFS
jgi:hypothetical protein